MNKKNLQLINKLKRKAMLTSCSMKNEHLSDNEISKNLKNGKKQFVKTNSWKELRLQAIEMYGNVCVKCKKVGSKKYPINIDHIKPRLFYPELAMDITNLQPLCGRCNKEKGNNAAIDYRGI